MSEVYRAINAVAAELALEGIAKSRSSQKQDYKFRGIDDMYNALSPLLAKHGLCVLPRALERVCVERQTKNGGTLFYTTLRVEFDFVAAEDGSLHTVATYGEAMDSGDKSTNKAMSAAYKYAVMQAFAIPTEGDHDAEATTHDVAPARPQNGHDSRPKPPPPTWPDGPYPNKTQAQAAFAAIKRDGEAAADSETFEAIIDDAQSLMAQFRLAGHPWWHGGKGDERYQSIPEWIERRRGELSAMTTEAAAGPPHDPGALADEAEFPDTTESFRFLVASLRQTRTEKDRKAWLAEHADHAKSLVERECDLLRDAANLHRETIKQINIVAA